MLYIDFCMDFQNMVSINYFADPYLEPLIILADDPVADVRAKFAEQIPKLRLNINIEESNTLSECHQRLLADSNE